MSYSEEGGQVVLRMSREDYQTLLIIMGYAMGGSFWVERNAALAFVNRLNSGNPNYTPYQVEEKKS
jgi:hypothetical protein